MATTLLGGTVATGEPLAILKRVFGFEQFQGLQEAVINQILAGRDALVLMPTGGGKSLCYQIPALILPGLTVVVSPLVALMKDQVDGLRDNGVAAAYLNSSQSAQEALAVWDLVRSGELRLLYVSPEKLIGGALTWLAHEKIAFFAIDEAHCISFWGHDFRPEYAQLGRARELFPGIPFVALTATADPTIRRDILSQLGIAESQVFQSSFDRPNLSLTVRPGQKRFEQIQVFLRDRRAEPGIIYCLSRAGTEDLAAKLQREGYQARAYHAGMNHNERSAVQEAFGRDAISIVCATVAFGMGIDKSNIRWVLHYNLPKNLESYYQEIGRAGRDGLPADTILFYSYADVAQQLRLMEDSAVERRAILEAKLERLKQYAEATLCRRRVLLGYFGEALETDCGHCDVCRNPPERFDATTPAQKLLSVVARTGGEATLRQAVLVLRASQAQDLLDRRWHEIKTYGAGRDIKFEDWMDYGIQLINGGWCDLAYDQGQTLKLNAQSRLVLKGERPVWLVKRQERIDPQPALQPTEPTGVADPNLVEVLKQTRRRLADEHDRPAYIIFSDKTLKDMALRRPRTSQEFLAVNGVGEAKLEAYGPVFLRAIGEWLDNQTDKQA